MVEDVYILSQMKRKDESVLTELMDKYKSYIYAIVNRIIGYSMSTQDVEEVCNDVFYKLWMNCEKIDLDKGSLKTYLSSIARNTAKNKLRELKITEVFVQDSHRLQVPDVYELVEQKEMSMVIGNALKELKPIERVVMVKFYYYYEPITKIAMDLQMNQNTVKSILKRTRHKLEKSLSKREGI